MLLKGLIHRLAKRLVLRNFRQGLPGACFDSKTQSALGDSVFFLNTVGPNETAEGLNAVSAAKAAKIRFGTWCERAGQVPKLIQGAIAERPGNNAALSALAAELGIEHLVTQAVDGSNNEMTQLSAEPVNGSFGTCRIYPFSTSSVRAAGYFVLSA